MCLRRKKVPMVTIPDIVIEQERLQRAQRQREQVVAQGRKVKRTVSEVKKLRQQNGIGEALEAIFRKDDPQ